MYTEGTVPIVYASTCVLGRSEYASESGRRPPIHGVN